MAGEYTLSYGQQSELHYSEQVRYGQFVPPHFLVNHLLASHILLLGFLLIAFAARDPTTPWPAARLAIAARAASFPQGRPASCLSPSSALLVLLQRPTQRIL